MSQSEFTDKAKRAAKDLGEELAGNFKAKLGDKLSEYDLEGVQAAATELADEAAVFVRKHPLSSVLGAAAAGFVLGLLVNRK